MFGTPRPIRILLSISLLAGCGEAASSASSGGSGGTPSSAQGGASSGGTPPSFGGSASGGAAASTSAGASGTNAGGNQPGGSGAGGSSSGAGGSRNGGSSSGAGGVTDGGRGESGAGGVTDGGAGESGGSAGNGGDRGESGASGGEAGTPCAAPALGSNGTNPLFTDQYTSEPAPLIHDCKFYIACGHDEGSTSWLQQEWFVLASTDMVHWTKQVALRTSDFAWASGPSRSGQIVGAQDGQFYWYVSLTDASGAAAIGVAVANAPTGPWQDALGGPLVDDALEMAQLNFAQAIDTPRTLDPTVLVDDDGQAYLHYGGFGRMVVAKLGSDMLSIDGKLQEKTPPGFFEGAYSSKRGETYYEFYSTGVSAPTAYATSSSPLGPWTRRGNVLDAMPNEPGDDGATSQVGVAEFAGQWYLTYHVSNGPNGGSSARREVALDKLTFDDHGSIAKVKPSAGLTF
ncbi:MAG: family 43 glycosylhydrolase [Polyangiaceae bacterium]